MKHLKHLFTALLLLCCIGTAKAEEVTIDGIKYDVVTKAKQAMVIKGGNYSGEIVIPSEITYNDVIYSVTSIGVEAFYNCTGLTSITIPNSVTSIGSRAFQYCSGLKEVHISDLTAWCNIDFGSYNTNPLYYAKNLYLNNELVTELVIPNDVTKIKSYAFFYCFGLTSIEIPNNVTSIGDYAFQGCTGLTSVVIPNSVTFIGVEAFRDCTGLTSIEIPNSVTRIANLAFSGCTGLTGELVIPNSVTSIGEYAFSSGIRLTNVEIPNSVTSIEKGAFYNCSGLTGELKIPNSVTSIGVEAFRDCTGLTSIEIPNSVTRIANLAFSGCTGLTGELVIPNSVTSIGEYAFSSGIRLTNVEIPNSVTSIEKGAFYNCSSLTSVTIGSGVKYIYTEAFAKCSDLTDIYCLAPSVPSTNAAAFKDSYPEYMTLHVPAEAIDSYKTTAPWSSFGTFATQDGEDIIEPEVKICAIPTVSYSNGKLLFECETEGAEFVANVTCSDINKFYDSEINLSATYNISVYATATGYENSDIVNATLCWIECECDGDDYTNVINVPAKAVLVTSNGGVLSISCQLDGEEVAVYTTAGTLIATTAIENGTATVATGLSSGSVAIVKIAGKSIKVAVN